MSKTKLPQLVASTRNAVSKHSPGILMGFGIGGMIATTVLAVTATPKAMACIEEEKRAQNRALIREAEELGHDTCTQIGKLRPLDVVRVTWKCYIPAAITGVLSTSCLLLSGSVHARRNAALATAYKLSETALREYREQVIDTIGEKKEQVVREKVNQKKLDDTPVTKSEIYYTGKGTTLFLEPLSTRYFESDIDRVRKAENVLNKQMLHDICGSVSVNEFYDELGIERTDLGDRWGWNTDNLIDLDITPGVTDDMRPCLVIGHNTPPVYDY